MMRAGYAGSPSTPSASRRSAPGSGDAVESTATDDRRRRPTRGSARATARGASGPSARPSRRGAPPTPPFEGFWWLYVPMRFDDYAVVLILQEDPDGFRTLNDCDAGLARTVGVEQLGWPRVRDRPTASGTRVPDRRDDHLHRRRGGKPLHARGRSRWLAVPLHVGGGYGGDSDWTHGQLEGAGLHRAA